MELKFIVDNEFIVEGRRKFIFKLAELDLLNFSF